MRGRRWMRARWMRGRRWMRRRHAVNQKQTSNLQTLFSSHSANISGSRHHHHSPFPSGIFLSHLDLPRRSFTFPSPLSTLVWYQICSRVKISAIQLLPYVMYLIVIAVISSSCVTLPFDIKAISLRIFLYCHDARVCFAMRAGWSLVVW